MDSDGNYLEDGDLVEFHRKCAKHWGIYNGGWIIHVTGEAQNTGSGLNNPLNEIGAALVGNVNAYVKKEKLKDVAMGDKFYKNNRSDEKCKKVYSGEEVIARATQWIGQSWKYSLLLSNCEHFASEMRYGESISLQVYHFIANVNLATGSVAGTGMLSTVGAITII